MKSAPYRHCVGLRAALAIVCCMAAFALGGCASGADARALAATLETVSAQADLQHVPFVGQEDHTCGPAALAMVLQANGQQADLARLTQEVYLPGRSGTLQTDMLAAARRRGLLAHVVEPNLTAVLREVAAGHPVIVYQNLSLDILPVWHYAVVVGYDLHSGRVWLHSGTTARMEMSMFAFENTWSRGDHWAMVALPVGKLPATGDAQTIARSVAALERAQPRAAMAAYQTALKRWPQDRSLWLGLGNAAYASHEPDAATSAWRQALALDPGYAPAWNNLAQLAFERGDATTARAAIAQAVAAGGPRQPQYLALQGQLQD